MLIATKDKTGVAIRGHKAYGRNIGKVAVKWKGRRTKIYWHLLDDLEFLEAPVDPYAYVAQPPGNLLNYPPLPSPPGHNEFDFGQNLKSFRLDRKLKQWELAALVTKTGVHVVQTTISNWERRKEAPDGAYVEALAKALDVPALTFFINYRDCVWLDATIVYLTKVREVVCSEGTV
jgi:hypothetical protein